MCVKLSDSRLTIIYLFIHVYSSSIQSLTEGLKIKSEIKSPTQIPISHVSEYVEYVIE